MDNIQNRLICTVDFDSTLSRKDVQEYVKELLASGIDVWVLTSRYDQLHLTPNRNPNGYTNEDLWTVVDEVGIPRWKVIFSNMEWKSEYLTGTDVIWHLDDDSRELSYIRKAHIGTIGIQVEAGSWKQKCKRILKNKIKQYEKSSN